MISGITLGTLFFFFFYRNTPKSNALYFLSRSKHLCVERLFLEYPKQRDRDEWRRSSALKRPERALRGGEGACLAGLTPDTPYDLQNPLGMTIPPTLPTHYILGIFSCLILVPFPLSACCRHRKERLGW